MTEFIVTLAQTAPELGHIQRNLAQHLDILAQAAQEGADLVVFPELSLTGYYVRDLMAELACKPTADDPVFGQLLERSRQLAIDAVVGFIEEDQRGRFFISAAYISRGEVLHVHRKVYLPTYTMFDDGRYFAAGDSARAFDTPLGRVGLLICEDYWHVALPYVLWMDGADLFIFINASPGRGVGPEPRAASLRWIETVSRAYGGIFTNLVVNCNRAGFEDGIAFGGGSNIIGPDGEVVARCPDFEPAVQHQHIDLNDLRRTRARLPLLRDERPDITLRELTRVLRASDDR
ncbi:MAG: nitrilase-related carbon-nitrogen hydrolase [Anaerolineales bacterium]